MQWDHQYSFDRVLSVCCRWWFHWWPWRGSRMLGWTTLATMWMNMFRFSRIKMTFSGVEDWNYESADGQLSCCKWVKRQTILLGLVLFLLWESIIHTNVQAKRKPGPQMLFRGNVFVPIRKKQNIDITFNALVKSLNRNSSEGNAKNRRKII